MKQTQIHVHVSTRSISWCLTREHTMPLAWNQRMHYLLARLINIPLNVWWIEIVFSPWLPVTGPKMNWYYSFKTVLYILFLWYIVTQSLPLLCYNIAHLCYAKVELQWSVFVQHLFIHLFIHFSTCSSPKRQKLRYVAKAEGIIAPDMIFFSAEKYYYHSYLSVTKYVVVLIKSSLLRHL